MMQLTDGERIARDLCEAESPIDNIIEVDPTDVARRIDESFAELRAQLAAAQEQQQTTFLQLSHALRIAEDQLAKAEQRVAEDCAKWIDGYSGIHQKEMLSDTAKSFADALRRGEWRKFVKEV